MSQYLPTDNFKLLTPKQIKQFDINDFKNDGQNGLILEVDLEYPGELHDLRNNDEIEVSENMLSNYAKNVKENFGISAGDVQKVIPTVNNKEKYVLHYRNLQLYLLLSLNLTKIHRVLQFDQSDC